MPRPLIRGPRDLSHVAKAWDKAGKVWGLPHYLAGRGLSADTVAAYASALRMDKRGNVLFSHTNDAGQVVGYEVKGRGKDGQSFTGFAKGGVRILCRLGPLDAGEPSKIALTESGIDALSLAQLTGRRDALYLSTGGAVGDHTLTAIKALAAKFPAAEILLAFDADLAGDALARTVERALAGREGVRRVLPPGAKDWNDRLKARAASPPAPG